MHHRDALLSKVSRIIAAYLFNIHAHDGVYPCAYRITPIPSLSNKKGIKDFFYKKSFMPYDQL